MAPTPMLLIAFVALLAAPGYAASQADYRALSRRRCSITST